MNKGIDESTSAHSPLCGKQYIHQTCPQLIILLGPYYCLIPVFFSSSVLNPIETDKKTGLILWFWSWFATRSGRHTFLLILWLMKKL